MQQEATWVRGGLEDLRWNALDRGEKNVVATLLEGNVQDHDAILHLNMVADQIREVASIYGGAVPLILTPRQNRAVAQVLQDAADHLESDESRDLPRRAVQFFAGYVRTLLDRLIRGYFTRTEAVEDDRASSMLLLQRAGAALLKQHETGVVDEDVVTRQMRQAFERLGLGREEIGGLLEEVAPEALKMYVAQQKTAETLAAEQAVAKAPGVPAAPPSADVEIEEDALDLDLAQAGTESRQLARRVFDAAIAALAKNDKGWPQFLQQLNAGKLPGLEGAVKQPAVAATAANTAYTVTTLMRNHLQNTAGLSREAVLPGLKAILDRYPGLKKRDSLKSYVKSVTAALKSERDVPGKPADA